MIQMQNLQSSLADTVFASSGKSDNMTSGTEGSSFMDILSNVSSGSKAAKAESKDSGSSAGTDRSLDPDNASSSANRDSSEKENVSEKTSSADGEKETVKAQNQIEGDTDAQVIAGSVMTSELLAMMNVQNVDVSAEAGTITSDAVQVIVSDVEAEMIPADVSQTAEAVVNTVQLQAEQASQAADVGQLKAETDMEAEDSTVTVKAQEADSQIQNSNVQTVEVKAEARTEVRAEVSAGQEEKGQGTEAESADPENAAGVIRNESQQTFNTDETVQVKVSEGAQLESKVVDQTADTIIARISEGTQEFEMTLTPESLGKVVIRIVFEEGKAQVHMTASDPAAQRALNMNLASVKQLIEDATGYETSVNVEDPDGKFGSYEDQRNEHEQEEEGKNRSESEETDENDTMSFIQQLRLGLVGDETSAI